MAIMRKKEIVRMVVAAAAENNVKATVSQTDAIVKMTLQSIKQCLANGDSVQFADFGTFSASERAARKGHNPATGESIEIPAKKVPTFKAASTFKAMLNAEETAE